MKREILEVLYQKAISQCHTNEPWLFEEKFAELIINESSKIADEPGARIPSYYIKKYFGVEE